MTTRDAEEFGRRFFQNDFSKREEEEEEGKRNDGGVFSDLLLLRWY